MRTAGLLCGLALATALPVFGADAAPLSPAALVDLALEAQRKRDYRLSGSYLDKAAGSSSARAWFELVPKVRLGENASRDDEREALLTGLAAEHGHVPAQLALGRMHWTGYSNYKPDLIGACAWFTAAAHGKSAEARKELSLLEPALEPADLKRCKGRARFNLDIVRLRKKQMKALADAEKKRAAR